MVCFITLWNHLDKSRPLLIYLFSSLLCFALPMLTYCFSDRDVTVYLSLWDEAASTFRGLLKAGDKTKSLMLVTTVNPKLFGGSDHLLPASFQSGLIHV